MLRFKPLSCADPCADHAYQQDEEPCYRCDRPVRFAIPHDVVEVTVLSGRMGAGAYAFHTDTDAEQERVQSGPGYMGFQSLCSDCASRLGPPYVLHGILDGSRVGFRSCPRAVRSLSGVRLPTTRRDT